MRPATKQWLFLILLVASLAALIAIALWQMKTARRKVGPGAAEPPRSSAPAR